MRETIINMTSEREREVTARMRLERYLTSRGLRKTPERFAILEAVCEIDGHFDAEELYKIMEARSYHVSLVTVYNTLQLLSRAGIIDTHRLAKRGTVFEMPSSGHIHLVCSQCGKVREEVDPELMEILSQKRYRGFTPASFGIDIFGLCSSCVRKNRKNINKNNKETNGKS